MRRLLRLTESRQQGWQDSVMGARQCADLQGGSNLNASAGAAKKFAKPAKPESLISPMLLLVPRQVLLRLPPSITSLTLWRLAVRLFTRLLTLPSRFPRC